MRRMKLKARIVELYGTQDAFAEAIGVTRQTVTNTVRGHSVPQRHTWDKWAEALKVSRPDLVTIFFEL